MFGEDVDSLVYLNCCPFERKCCPFVTQKVKNLSVANRSLVKTVHELSIFMSKAL